MEFLDVTVVRDRPLVMDWLAEVLSSPTVIAALVACFGVWLTVRQARQARRADHRREQFEAVARAFVAQTESLVGYLNPASKLSGGVPSGLLESAAALFTIQFVASTAVVEALMKATRAYADCERRLAILFLRLRRASRGETSIAVDLSLISRGIAGASGVPPEFVAAAEELLEEANRAIAEFRAASSEFIAAAREDLGFGQARRFRKLWKQHAEWQEGYLRNPPRVDAPLDWEQEGRA